MIFSRIGKLQASGEDFLAGEGLYLLTAQH